MNARIRGRVFVLVLLICALGLTVAQAQQSPIDDPSLYVSCANGFAICDLHTGLMWERKVVGEGACLTSLHAVNAVCLFSETAAWIAALNAENGVGYAGFSDWRLPNIKELQSIVNYSSREPAAHTAFAPTGSGDASYWSSTLSADVSGDVWIVDFFDGLVLLTGADEMNHVRAVRGGRTPATPATP